MLRERLLLITETKLTAEQMTAEAECQLQEEKGHHKRLLQLIEKLGRETFLASQVSLIKLAFIKHKRLPFKSCKIDGQYDC